ncbi:MAG: hypothetical protein OXI57_03755 [Rhodospirillales bacterium]|nr:hypothetical protein [Rhodospirillales bacterium]
MLSLGTTDEESMMDSADPRIGLQAISDTKRMSPALAAAMLGVIALFGVAWAEAAREKLNAIIEDAHFPSPAEPAEVAA